MISVKRPGLTLSMLLLACGTLRAQGLGWEVGAAAGVVNDVQKNVELSGFGHSDVNFFVGYETSENVIVRATYGSLRVAGSNAGVTPAGGVPLPDLTDRINYVTLGAAYTFKGSVFTSGLFAGIGGYRIEPDAADPSISRFRDPDQSVWGFHAGLDESIRIAPRLSVLVRLTYHNIRSSSGRSLLTVDGGLAYRF